MPTRRRIVFAAALAAAHASGGETTVISSPIYSWIFIYVFDMENSFGDYRDLLFYPVETDRILLISDQHFQYNIDAGEQLQDAYDNTESIATFEGNVLRYDLSVYPYTSMVANYEGSVVEIRAN